MNDYTYTTTKAKVLCKHCNNTFEINMQDTAAFRSSSQCKVCLTTMDQQMAEKLFLTMGALDDLNRDFRKYADSSNENAFQISLECLVVPE